MDGPRKKIFMWTTAAATMLLFAAFLLQAPGPPTVEAAPHAVRSDVDHPFDPDWLEIRLMLNTKCAGCHRPGGEHGDLTSYEKLIAAKTEDGEPLVVAGRPDDSPLWDMVAWNVEAKADSEHPSEPEMPHDMREWLTVGQLATVRRWIAGGALEYVLPKTCSVRPLLEVDFPSAKECKVCHPRQYGQWSRSMHHYAQHSPIFEAFNLTLQERTGGTLGTFCSRCHTPLGTALGENGLHRNIHRSRLSMEGVSCVVCHRMKQPYYKSNSRDAIEPGALLEGCMVGPFESSVSAKVKSHGSVEQPYLKTSQFCGGCHDVTSPTGVRLEEAFSEWQNSPAARQGITCQQCHMGPVQGIPTPEDHRPLGRAAVVPGVAKELIPLRRLSDHTFAGPDYSLLPDSEFPHKLDWMAETDYTQAHRLTPYQQKTLLELRRGNRRDLQIAEAKRYELLKNAAEISVCCPPTARPGEKIDIGVVVQSKFSGHSFPTGFTAERQAWVRVTLRDPTGAIVFQSGDLDSNGDLRDSHSHEVQRKLVPADKHLLNFQNKFVALTQRGTERTVILSVNRHLTPLNFVRPATGISASFGRPQTFRIAKGSLPPLGTVQRSYQVVTPTAPGPYTLDVRLNFRHLPPVLLDEIGASHLKHLLEIVEIDRRETTIWIGQPRAESLSSPHGEEEVVKIGRRGAASHRSP